MYRSLHTLALFSSQRHVSVHTDTKILLNSFRLVNRIRFDFKTLLAESEADSEIFLPNPAFDADIRPRGF